MKKVDMKEIKKKVDIKKERNKVERQKRQWKENTKTYRFRNENIREKQRIKDKKEEIIAENGSKSEDDEYE